MRPLARVREQVPCLPVWPCSVAQTPPSLELGADQYLATARHRARTIACARAQPGDVRPARLECVVLAAWGVARVVSELAQARALSAREVQILTYCLGNEPRKRVRRRLGIAENTLKTQIRSLLRKCDERSVDAWPRTYCGRRCLRGVSAPSQFRTGKRQSPQPCANTGTTRQECLRAPCSKAAT